MEVGPRLESRLARQTRLGGDTPTVINQAALLQEVGSRAVLAHQLEHLAAVIEDKHDHVEIRIMPFNVGAHPLTGYPLTILSFDSPRLPDLLWQETISSQAISDRRATLRECAASFDAAIDQSPEQGRLTRTDPPHPQGDRMTTTAHEPRTPAAGGWFKSSRSGAAGECVEINFNHPDGLVRIRDTKDRGEGLTISVTGEQWAILLDELAGTVPAGRNGAVTVKISRSGTTLLRAISDGTTLRFTKGERRAFLAGARVRECDYPGMSITVR